MNGQTQKPENVVAAARAHFSPGKTKTGPVDPVFFVFGTIWDFGSLTDREDRLIVRAKVSARPDFPRGLLDHSFDAAIASPFAVRVVSSVSPFYLRSLRARPLPTDDASASSITEA
jgi:hypothetical protein